MPPFSNRYLVVCINIEAISLQHKPIRIIDASRSFQGPPLQEAFFSNNSLLILKRPVRGFVEDMI